MEKKNGWCDSEVGASMVEYGILIGLIAIICLISVNVIGKKLSQSFSGASSAL